jgi:hypothetical protein
MGNTGNSIALSLISALVGGGVIATPQPFYSREREPVPILQEAEWNPRPVSTGTEIMPLPGFHHRTVQPVMSRYTDCAVVDRTAPRYPSEKNLIVLQGKLITPSAVENSLPELKLLRQIPVGRAV